MALKLMFDRNNIYIFPWYVADLTLSNDIKEIIGITHTETFIVFNKGFVKAYFDFDSMQRVGQVTFDKIINDKDFFNQVIDNIYKFSTSLEEFSKDVDKKDVANLSDNDLVTISRDYVKELRRLRAWGWVPVLLDGITKSFLSDYLRQELKEYLIKINQEDALVEYYSVLSSSEKESEVQKEEVGRLDLLLKFEELGLTKALEDIKNKKFADFAINYPEAHALLQEHLKNYGWLTYGYVGPTMTLEYLFNVLTDNLARGSISQQKEKIKNHYLDLHKQKQGIIEKISLPAELVRLFEISAELMFIKDYRKGIYQKSYVAMDRVLIEIAKRLEVSLKDLKFLLVEEMAEALLSKEKDRYKKIVSERVESCCYYVVDGQIKVYEGQAGEDMIEKISSKIFVDKVEDVDEVRGTVAYKGEVSGVVKIVLVVDDIAKVNEGDILVSSATNPDLILAMKRAAAFVTDMGGITSHASIVAREMKKPCIVGTKNATHVFKDGDKVIVDAINGLVKKII